MRKTEKIVIISIVAPYFFVLFFLRYIDSVTFFGLLLFNAFLILGCLGILALTKPTRFKRRYYFIAAFIFSGLFVKFMGGLVEAGDQVFFYLHKGRMEKIVKEIVHKKRSKQSIELPSISFAQLDTLETGEVIFTLDGMLDNCMGIAYSENNENPGYTNCGRIVTWRKLDDHWYFWYTT